MYRDRASIQATQLYEIEIEHMTGKESKYLAQERNK